MFVAFSRSARAVFFFFSVVNLALGSLAITVGIKMINVEFAVHSAVFHHSIVKMSLLTSAHEPIFTGFNTVAEIEHYPKGANVQDWADACRTTSPH